MSITRERRQIHVEPDPSPVGPPDTRSLDAGAGGRAVAEVMRPLVRVLLGSQPRIRVEFWDGSGLGPENSPARLVVRSSDALRRVLWAPGELGLSRAYVAGDIDVEGDVMALVAAMRDGTDDLQYGPRLAVAALRGARRVGALGWPVAPPPEEARPRGRRHSRRRDASVVGHHYDVGNDFYGIVLGPTLTYSCALYASAGMSLAEAQDTKHEGICRKLGLHEQTGRRLLDVGCGWGSMAIHAAQHHQARVVGITISREQAQGARRRVQDAGLSHLIDIRLQDYRELVGEQFDAISSVGMFEHVGAARTREYFATLRSLLRHQGRLLNHAISSVNGSSLGRRSFMYRYVFPDGELADCGDVVLAMERAGLEVRDVESLREHYAQTLRHWVANLEGEWDRAVALAGPARARIWRLYMAASAIGFERGSIGVHQVLGVVPDDRGNSGMPRTRAGWA